MVLTQAWNGDEWTKGVKYRSMRAIFPMYDTPFQFVAAKRLRIHWLDDLAGFELVQVRVLELEAPIFPLIFKALDIKSHCPLWRHGQHGVADRDG